MLILVIGLILIAAIGAAIFWLSSKKKKTPTLRRGKKRKKTTKLTKTGLQLLESASKGDVDGVRDALKKAPLETTGKDDRTALHLAAARAHEAVSPGMR